MVLNLGALFQMNRSHFGVFSDYSLDYSWYISDYSLDDLNGNDKFVDSPKVAKQQRLQEQQKLRGGYSHCSPAVPVYWSLPRLKRG